MADAARSKLEIAIVAAIVAVLAVPAWTEIVRPNLFPKRFAVVTEGKVYRSGELTPGALEHVVKENQIKTIVDLGAFRDDPVGEERERKTAAALGVMRYQMFLYGDASGNPNYYLQALRIMNDPAQQPVLVHCGAGTHRTGCAVAMYRTAVEGMSREKALQEAMRFKYDPSKHAKFTEMFNLWEPKVGAALKSGTKELSGADPIAEPVPVLPAPK